jgi:pleckstrin homology domain-containing family H
MDSAGIDYHVMLAANAFQQCLDVPELQPELLCALIKQTSYVMATSDKVDVGGSSSTKGKSSGRSGKKSFLMHATHLFSSDGSSNQKTPASTHVAGNPAPLPQADPKANPSTCILMQGWMLMAMAVSIFVPKDSKLLWFLRTHFNRNKNSK